MITLHVDLGEQWRGGQHQALELMLGLQSRGHTAELVATRRSPLAQRAQERGIRVHAVGRFAPRLQAAFTLRRLLGQGRFEVVHSHDAHGLTSAWLAGSHHRASLVASRRVVYPLVENRFALARYRHARRIIAVSRFVRDKVLAAGIGSSQVEVVYDGVELPPLPGAPGRYAGERWGVPDSSGGALIGYVGYFLPDKGHEFLIRAMPLLHKRYPNCRLLLPGDGPCRSRLEALAQRLGLQSTVRFPGVVDNIEQVYQALDIFVFPSLAEGLGGSLLSAMAYGLPSIAAAGCAAAEVVQDEYNGLLVPARAPDAIARAVKRLLDNPGLRAKLGAAARETIEQRFSADRMVQQTLEIYEQVRGEAARSS